MKSTTILKYLLGFLLLIVMVFFVFNSMGVVFAQNAIQSNSSIPDLKLQVPFQGYEKVPLVTVENGTVVATGMAQYFGQLYSWLVLTVSIVAVIMIMRAGLLWLTSRGSGAQLTKAKKMISNSILGLVLTLSSYLILYFISPTLVQWPTLRLGIVSKLDILIKEIPDIVPANGESPAFTNPPLTAKGMPRPYTALTINPNAASCPTRDPRVTNTIINGALDMQHKYGIPAAVSVAQWAQESAYGGAVSGVYNYFGIKCTQTTPPCAIGCSEHQTLENVNGKNISVQACFKDYSTAAEGFEGHARYLTLYHMGNSIPTKTGNWYDFNGDPVQFARFIKQEGYATDPNYSNALEGIMKTNCLIP